MKANEKEGFASPRWGGDCVHPLRVAVTVGKRAKPTLKMASPIFSWNAVFNWVSACRVDFPHRLVKARPELHHGRGRWAVL